MISIILIVKNDRRVEKCLERLVRVPKPEETEILVIDASEASLSDIRDRVQGVRWIYYRGGNGITIAKQRNLGIKMARGEIIVFIDSDCVPDEDWLVELIKPLRSGEHVVSGKIVSQVVSKDTYGRESQRYIKTAPTNNLAFFKRICGEVGFFDESFEYGSDVDFTWRLSKQGFKIRYMKSAILHHDEGGIRWEFRRQFYQGKARAKLLRKHLGLWSNAILPLAYILYALLLPISYFLPYYPLLILVPLAKNLRNRPIRTTITHFANGAGFLYELAFKKRL